MTLMMLLGMYGPVLGATTIFPAATNAPNVFFGTNLFTTNAAFQGFVLIGTNILQNQGSKLNGLGFTNSVVSGTLHFIGDTSVSVITGDGNLFYGSPLLAFYFDKDVHAPSFTATNATGGFVGDGSLITGLDAANISGTLSVAQINVGTVVVTNAMAVNLTGSTNYAASNVVSGGVLPAGTVSPVAMAAGLALGTDGSNRVWTNSLNGVSIGGNAATASAVNYATNLSTMAPDFNKAYSEITTNAPFTFLAPLNVSLTTAPTAVIMVINSSGTNITVTAPVNVHAQGTWNITNRTTFTFWTYGGTYTNAIAFPLF